MVSVGSLTEEQRQVLRRLRRRAVGRVAERAQMVLLSARGYPVADIAEIFEVGEDVVRTWLHRYQREGAAGLQDRRRPGRPPKDRLARHIVDAQASNPPCNSGLARTCWTAGLLAAFLAWRFHLVLSPASARRLLHAAGWRSGRPRLAPAEHAPVRLLWLPKYSAHEHNPIERAWGLLKDAVAANRLHGSIEELIAVADRFLATTAFQAPDRQATVAVPAVAA